MQTDTGQAGRWTALTAFTPVRRPWSWWLRWGFWPLVKRVPGTLDGLRKLSLIGFARWSLFDRVPVSGPRRGARRLPQPYLPFESNFNGSSDEYLEAFALGVPWGVRGTWFGACHVPDAAKVGDFERNARRVHITPAYYYCAYPDASAKMIRSALELARRLVDFREHTSRIGDEAFRREYLDFLAGVTRIRDPRAPKPERHSGMISILLPVAEGHAEALGDDLGSLFDAPLPVPPKTTHFARWTVVPELPCCSGDSAPGAHLLFSAWFDGTEDDYLRDLEARMGDRGGRIRGHCVASGSADRMPMGLPFLGYDGATVPEIRAALADAQRFSTFAVQSQGLPAAQLRRRWRADFPAP